MSEFNFLQKDKGIEGMEGRMLHSERKPSEHCTVFDVHRVGFFPGPNELCIVLHSKEQFKTVHRTVSSHNSAQRS